MSDSFTSPPKGSLTIVDGPSRDPVAAKATIESFLATKPPKPKAKTVGDVFGTVDSTAAQIVAATTAHNEAVSAVHGVFDSFEVVVLSGKTLLRDKDALTGYRDVVSATEATVID